ncbi:MAG: DUF4399 domain-containing protein [Gammaproteobacteria bacterium]|nr:DUF4399 domain-containing protein [Gammaproteobacteria bacterium]MDH4256063.1 DUF4399 domain-containing protein [Gammaproteobacteria bacterium]MDH5311485.1 DUF4399 domain-containing protein [Gammaproteobacteria bacterium]
MLNAPDCRRVLWTLPVLVAVGCGGSGSDDSPGSATEPSSQAPQAEMPAQDVAPAMPRSAAPAGARVFFITPADGDVVSNPVVVEFGIDGMSVVPAGQEQADSGHHHVIIDAELPALDLPIPKDARHVHFGEGNSRAELTLEPGQHSLQLLFADHLHIPHAPPVVSDRITITVE